MRQLIATLYAKEIIMNKQILLIFLLSSLSCAAHAQLPESECYELQTEAYKHAEKDNPDPKQQLELSMKLTEECGYLMSDEALKQRREYNYLLYKSLNIDK